MSDVSIPRSGFCSFKLHHKKMTIVPLLSVSIPRSGFCSFKRCGRPVAQYVETGFNPSVGILFIQAPKVSGLAICRMTFQSLGRDSVHSSARGMRIHPHYKTVSIPRSGFCSFKLEITGCGMLPSRCFNPSVGILFIQASLAFRRWPP